MTVPEGERGHVPDVIGGLDLTPYETASRVVAGDRPEGGDLTQRGPPIDLGEVLEPDEPGKLRQAGHVGQR